MSLADSDQLIMEAVQKHYEDHDSPYYLAALGMFLRSENIEIPDGVRLRNYLIKQFAGRLIVVQDENVPARIAIAPLEKASIIRQQWSDQTSVVLDESKIDHARLPLALVAAFCKITSPGTQLYFRLTKPFRYAARTQAPDDNHIEIGEQFRPQSLAGMSVHEMSYSDRQTIYEHIEKWAEAKSIDLRDIYYDRGVKSAGQTKELTEVNSNALQRLINAQEPELKGRILIPSDIVIKLMRIP